MGFAGLELWLKCTASVWLAQGPEVQTLVPPKKIREKGFAHFTAKPLN
jgi:hypothetical protein